MQRWLTITILAASIAIGCLKPNPAYCPAHPEDPACSCDAPSDCMAPTPACQLSTATCVQCIADSDCTGTEPGCELSTATCVECVTDSHCTGNEPVCDAGLNACRACSSHADCLSLLCLPDGSCAAVDDVSYVDGAAPTVNTTCTQALPCDNFEKAYLAATRPYIKASGIVTDDMPVTIENKTTTIFGAPGTTVTRSNAGDVFDIKGASTVVIHGLAIRGVGAQSGNGMSIRDDAVVSLNSVKIHRNAEHGISLDAPMLSIVGSEIAQNTGAGINADSGALTISSSAIHGNTGVGVQVGVLATTLGLVTIGSTLIANNSGGGLSVTADYTVTNSIISANGSPVSGIGGVLLATTNQSAVFQFNTVANNISHANVDGGARGISCRDAVVAVTNSILTNNVIATTCNVTYSLTTLPGTGNKSGVPMFVNIGIDALAAGFYRIATGSAAKDSANPAATLTVDIDGDPRPAGSADMGADETP